MSSSDIEYEVEPTSMEPRLTGVVKWFNNKSGFGFITVCQDGHPLHSKDIFCYYKSLRVVNLQFRYLVQGEYVDFTLVKAAVEPHEYQAVDVTGVKCGPLMCETRNMHTDIYNVKKGPGQGPYAHSQQYTKRPTQSIYNTKYAPVSTAPHIDTNSTFGSKKRPNTKSSSTDADGFIKVDRNHRKKTIVVV
jgi:cold shock CspA family protein